MKKTLAMISLAALAFAACEKTPEENPESTAAKIVSIKMSVANNSYLEEDLVINNPGKEINFVAPATVPDSLFIIASVEYELSKEDAVLEVVTPDGPMEIEQGFPLDLRKSVDVVVSCDGQYTPYVISLRNADIDAALDWNYAGYSKTNSGDSLRMNSEMVMKISPISDKPFMLGYVNGATTANNYPMLLTFDGVNLRPAADTLAKVRANYLGLDIAPNGIPFVTYYDNPAALQTVGIVKEGKFTALGTTIKSTGNTVTSAPVVAVSSDNVFAGCMANAAIDGVAKRGLYMANWTGGTITKPVQVSDRSLSTLTYNALSRKVNGVDYLLCLGFNDATVSVYKYDNGWKTVVADLQPLKADGIHPVKTAEYTYQSLDFDVDSKGNIYVFAYADFGLDDTKVPGVVKYNVATGAQTLVGGVITNPVGDNVHSKVRYAAMALDSNDNPYVVQGNTFVSDQMGVRVWNIDPKTRTWGAAKEITQAGEKYNGVEIEFGEDGTGYICLFSDTHKVYDLFVSKK